MQEITPIKINRNAPCPCGSGKKFKKCCALIKQTQETYFRNVFSMLGDLYNNHFEPYVIKTLGDPAYKEAWDEFFLLDESIPENIEETFWQFYYMPWFYFNWIPGDEDPELCSEQTIAEQYLEKHSDRLTNTQKELIKAILESHFSFYAVLNIDSGNSLTLKDIFLQKEVPLINDKVSTFLKRGDIIFARVLSFQGESMLYGIAPYTLDSHFHNILINYRSEFEQEFHQSLTPELLRRECEWDMRDLFFDLMFQQLNPIPPQMVTTDGDPVLFCKHQFELMTDPKTALEALLPMALEKKSDDILSHHTTFDEKRDIETIKFPWLKKGNKKHKDWDNTVLGHIVIDQNTLTVTLNSEKRAKKAKKLIQKHLEDKVIFIDTQYETLEEKFTKEQNKPSDDSQSITAENIDEQPEEVQAMIEELNKKHWESWLDTPIPALGNLSPREAAKTEEGRERLEALLLDYERNAERRSATNIFNPDFKALRATLMLETES